MQSKQNKPTSQKDSTIVELVSKYLPFWPLFLVSLLVAMAGAYAYLRYTVPLYEANATIIIKDEKKGNDDSKLIESMDLINTKKIIENEIEVLQSRSLMTAVAKKLRLYAPVSQEGKVKSLSAYVISPLIVEAQNPDSIIPVEKVALNYDPKSGVVTLDGTLKGKVNEWMTTPYGVLKFIHNDKYIPGKTEKPFFFSLISPNIVARIIGVNIHAAPSNKLSSVINLSYRDEIPSRAEDILNELIRSYGEAALAEKNTLAINTLAFIEERLNAVSHDLDSIEGKLQQYKAGRGAVDIGRQSQMYLENVGVADRRLSEINMQVAVIDQLEKAATSTQGSGLIPSTLGVTDPALTQQVNNLSQLQQQYDRLKITVGENNPQLVAIREQISNLKPTILSNIQSQRQSLEQSRGSLSATGGKYSSMLSSIPQKEKQLVEISRDQNIKNGIYSFLLQKREETELSYASSISDSRVVNNAQASWSPVSPKKSIIYILAIAFGLGLPFAFITLREILNPKVLYRQEIESMTKIPIIGEIGFNATKEPLVIKAGQRTVIAEEFRKIRVSMASLGVNADHKKVLITSSISGEGKSFIAANLASSISLTGKKVVLVDMDLHNPGLGKVFGIKDQPGIGDFLVGKKRLDQLIYKIPGNDNLFYISAGTLQQDPSEILENGKVQTLIAQLESDFDMVIIDTAPVVLITDAYLLSSLCDTTLYVIRHKITPKMFVKRIDDNMAINPIKNPGIVFNGVKTRGFFKNNYGYGYNNYVYSYDNKKKEKKSAS